MSPTKDLVVTSANTCWSMGHNRAYVRYLCEFSDVVLIQEAKDFDLKDAVPNGWQALQDTSDPGRKGACIAVGPGVKVIDHGIVLGAVPVVLGRRVRMLVRWIYWAKVEKNGRHYFVVSAHLPPARFKALWRGYERNLRAVIEGHSHTVVGTDANQSISTLARAEKLHAHGTGIVGLLTAEDLHVGANKISHYGIRHHLTDHPSVTIPVRPR